MARSGFSSFFFQYQTNQLAPGTVWILEMNSAGVKFCDVVGGNLSNSYFKGFSGVRARQTVDKLCDVSIMHPSFIELIRCHSCHTFHKILYTTSK